MVFQIRWFVYPFSPPFSKQQTAEAKIFGSLAV
jgi:hypothetical protein